MKKRFSDEQIVAILREAESGGKSAAEVCRSCGIRVDTAHNHQHDFPQHKRLFLAPPQIHDIFQFRDRSSRREKAI